MTSTGISAMRILVKILGRLIGSFTANALSSVHLAAMQRSINVISKLLTDAFNFCQLLSACTLNTL